MQLLHQTIESSATTAMLPIVGPSVVKPADQAAIGNLSAYLDYGNVHAYYGTNNPGNTGTGSITQLGRSGSVPYYVNAAGQMSGTKPLVASETGYGTNPAIAGNVSELCDGKEAPRTYFEHFKAGDLAHAAVSVRRVRHRVRSTRVLLLHGFSPPRSQPQAVLQRRQIAHRSALGPGRRRSRAFH